MGGVPGVGGGLAAIIWRTAVRRGFLGGQRPWFVVFAVIGAVKAFRRIAGGTQDVVYTGELKPGRALVITHHADVLHQDLTN